MPVVGTSGQDVGIRRRTRRRHGLVDPGIRQFHQHVLYFGLNVKPWFITLGAGFEPFPSKRNGIYSGALVSFKVR